MRKLDFPLSKRMDSFPACVPSITFVETQQKLTTPLAPLFACVPSITFVETQQKLITPLAPLLFLFAL